MFSRRCIAVLAIGGWLALGTAASVDDAQAFTYFITLPNKNKIIWPAKRIQYLASSRSFPAGSQRRTALDRVILRWNLSPSSFRFLAPLWTDTYGRKAFPGVFVDNDRSEIWYTSAANWGGAVQIGQILWQGPNAIFVESDVIFGETPVGPWVLYSPSAPIHFQCDTATSSV